MLFWLHEHAHAAKFEFLTLQLCVQTSVTALTAAEKSRRLLQQLQQKHVKPVNTKLQPAQQSALKGRHQPEASASVNDLEPHSMAYQMNMPLPGQRQQPRTVPTATVVKPAKRAIPNHDSALHHHNPASSGALCNLPLKGLSESVPHRTRAEGGRKRR